MKLITLAVLLMLTSLVSHSGDFVFGTQTCPTSGNKQVAASAANNNFFQLTVLAYLNNTGTVTLGGNTVVSSANTGMIPGASFNFSKPSNGVNPATIYMACTVSADSVWWIGSR